MILLSEIADRVTYEILHFSVAIDLPVLPTPPPSRCNTASSRSNRQLLCPSGIIASATPARPSDQLAGTVSACESSAAKKTSTGAKRVRLSGDRSKSGDSPWVSRNIRLLNSLSWYPHQQQSDQHASSAGRLPNRTRGFADRDPVLMELFQNQQA